MNDKTVRLGTHNGVFHADEVMAIAIITLAYERDDCAVEIVRTRNPARLAECDVVVDVGGEYDVAATCDVEGSAVPQVRLDHHQWRRGEGEFHWGLPEHPMSAAGLAWKHYGETVVLSADPRCVSFFNVDVRADVEKYVVEPICALDCGARPRPEGFQTLSSVISGFNPEWNDADANADAAFAAAVAFARGHLVRAISSAIAKADAEGIVSSAVETSEGPVLVLPQYAPWQGHLRSLAPDAADRWTFVVHPQGETWMVWQLPVDPEGVFAPGSFTGKLRLPAQWAGKRDAEAIEATGVTDAVFVHGGAFCAGAASMEGAVAMALRAIELAA